MLRSVCQVLDQISHNVRWDLIDNLHSVPEDCDQRNERWGWMADASVRMSCVCVCVCVCRCLIVGLTVGLFVCAWSSHTTSKTNKTTTPVNILRCKRAHLQ